MSEDTKVPSKTIILNPVHLVEYYDRGGEIADRLLLPEVRNKIQSALNYLSIGNLEDYSLYLREDAHQNSVVIITEDRVAHTLELA